MRDLQYFIKDNAHRYAGNHVLVDVWSNSNLDNLTYIQTTLEKAAQAASATILEKKFHVFSPNNGVTGVLVLAESHISIHTWPEAGFAAIDIFMCGECDVDAAVDIIVTDLKPEDYSVQKIKRGLVRAEALA